MPGAGKEEAPVMGFMDKIKGLFKGHKQEVKGGIDAASDQVEKRVGTQQAAKVDDVSQKAKDAVDKLAGDDAAGAPTPVTPAAPASAPADPAVSRPTGPPATPADPAATPPADPPATPAT
jgi:pilus assembly protein FimV